MRGTQNLKLAENVTGASLVPELDCTGGLYKLGASGTIGTSAIEFQNAHGDWIAAGAAIVTAVGQDIYLPPGKVRANLGSGASGAYVYLTRIPSE